MLCRAAIVKTISQVATIEGVIFEVADQPLMDSTGNLVGKMVDSDFVDIIARDINAIEFTQLAFYYTNETGDQLLKYETPVTYASDFSIEKYLLEELIKGAEKEGYPVVMLNRVRSEKENEQCVRSKSGFWAVPAAKR